MPPGEVRGVPANLPILPPEVVQKKEDKHNGDNSHITHFVGDIQHSSFSMGL
jgi:hypothetical protein